MIGTLDDAPRTVLSVDLGSSGIKVLRADHEPASKTSSLTSREMAHQPVQRGRYLEWDVDQLVLDVVAQESATALGRHVVVSIDTWGDALVFLDARGRRIGPVRCYRDPLLAQTGALLYEHGLTELVAARTGCDVGPTGTLAQLLAVRDEQPEWFGQVTRVVPLVDHLEHLLTGNSSVDIGLSSLSTSGFVDPRTGQVDRSLLEDLGLPPAWIPEPQPELRVAATISPDRLAVGSSGTVVKVAGHDTATALLADPGGRAGRVFVSLGSWAVVGVVVDSRQRASAPFHALSAVMHEATADGQLRVNRNVPALRFVQQLELEEFGRAATADERAWLFPLTAPWEDAPVVDVFNLDPRRSITDQVCEWARQHDRPENTPQHRAREIVRGIASAIATSIDDLQRAGIVDPAAGLWIAGGGVQVRALPAWIGDLVSRPVDLGPVAASAFGGAIGASSVISNSSDWS